MFLFSFDKTLISICHCRSFRLALNLIASLDTQKYPFKIFNIFYEKLHVEFNKIRNSISEFVFILG